MAIALIQAGGDPNTYLRPDDPSFRRSILRAAAVTGQSGVVAALIAHGVDLSADGHNALNHALWKGYTDIAAALIKGGVDVNATFSRTSSCMYLQAGETALQTAAQGGHLGMVEQLLQYGAMVNAVDCRGWTALHYAIRENGMPTVRALLSNGAVVSAEDLSVSLSSKNSELSEVLMSALNLAALSVAELESLIAVADSAGADKIINHLFDAKLVLEPDSSEARFVYARASGENCDVTVWNPRNNMKSVVYTEKGECTSQLFISDEADSLFVLTNDYVRTISLTGSEYESGHCAEDCVSTRGIRLKFPGKNEQVLANYIGNNTIVDRYALVWTKPRGYSELFDLSNGESVFGKLQSAGWTF